MPELPEVETIRRGLEPHLEGRVLTGVEILDPRLTRPEQPEATAARLTGATVTALDRRGKYLLLHLDTGDTAVHHLRMTGAFAAAAPADPDPVTHVRARYRTANGVVVYRDPRRFGTLMVRPAAEVAAYLDERLGPEPLADSFTSVVLRASLKGRSAPVKSALLNQRVVAGLGNIYVDEALFRARINPLAPAGSLSSASVERLQSAIVQVLELGLAAGGSSLRDYRTVAGEEGRMQSQFLAYGRGGEPCSECGRALVSGRLGGRSTTWCARCQRVGRSRS